MKTKFKSQRKGAVLATVTVVSVMMVVIIAAATQLVAHTSARTNKEYRKKQAYYVASSCLRAFVAETTRSATDAVYTDAEITEKITQLQRIAASGKTIPVEIQRLGTTESVKESQPRWNNAQCELRVEYAGSNKNENSLKAIATATYLGQTKTVVAYLSCKTLGQHTYTPRALEIIGTNGGNNKSFNNIKVYGSTGATLRGSHDHNTVYKFNWNDNESWGTMDINGSFSIQNNNRFRSNPYYYEGEDDTRGCILNVTRSLIMNANTPAFDPDHDKPIDDQNRNPNTPEYNYNYVNVGEALVVGAENALIGKTDDRSVDTYASFIYIGPEDKLNSQMKEAIANDSNDKNAYWEEMLATSSTRWGQGQENKFHGNVYVLEDGGKAFNGSMVIAGQHNHFYGDIYLMGDLYLVDNQPETRIDLAENSKIHLRNGNHIYNCNISFDNAGGIAKPTVTEVDNKFADKIVYGDWDDIPRAQRPEFPTLEETPYYYYPEHLMCHEGGAKTNVSTIDDQYRPLYKADGNGRLWELDKTKVLDVTNDKYKNNDGTKYEGENGAVYIPDYIVTDNVCYIDKLENKKILIDVDEADDDVVVVLKNGGYTSNQNVILVKNRENLDTENAHFCYFVSDSGVGETKDDYGERGEVSTYTEGSFNTPTFSFKGTQEVLMDLDAFLRCNVYTAGNDEQGYTAKGLEKGSLNPTADPGYPGYQLPSNNIIMLFTEGSTLDIIESNILFHASIYMPRATFHTTNKGGMCSIDPYFNDGSKMDALSIIGNLVCHNYNVEKGNCNAIVYNEVSPYSMLATVKGNGEQHATDIFQLDRYAAS